MRLRRELWILDASPHLLPLLLQPRLLERSLTKLPAAVDAVNELRRVRHPLKRRDQACFRTWPKGARQ
jgi:hypothetical protein